MVSLGPTLLASGCLGKLPNCGSRTLLSCNEVELFLEIYPELRFDTEPVPEPQRRIPGHRAFAGDDLADVIGRHIYLAGESCWGYAEIGQLVSQDRTGMNDPC